MALCINQSGTYRNITTLCINQAGTYRNIVTGCINQAGTYRNFGFVPPFPALGGAGCGGFLICCQGGGQAWIVAPSSSEVARTWYSREDSNTRSQQVSGCTGWFVPSLSQLQNPGYTCRTFWDSFTSGYYWSNELGGGLTDLLVICTGVLNGRQKSCTHCVRSFRCVTY